MAYYSSGNSFQKRNPVVLNLIIINVLMYIAQRLLVSDSFNLTEWGSLHYYKSPDFNIAQMLTNAFLHAPDDLMHLVFNMLCLFMFGVQLERVWGGKRFLIFYLACAIGASICIQFTIPISAELFAKSPEAAQYGGYTQAVIDSYKYGYTALGASGAIMGIEAAFAYLFPNTEFMMMLIPVPVKAKYMVLILVAIDLFGGFQRIAGDKVGHFAHLGGALTGFILVLIWNKTNKKTFY